MPDEYLQENVTKYEGFINDVLKEDLKKVIHERDKIYSRIADYLQLKRVIEELLEERSRNEITDMKVMTDIGCNFYCQAKIEDTSKVMIDVGFGFFVEFTLKEGVGFINKKVGLLTKKAEVLTSDSAKIKARIKLVLSNLRQLQMLEFSDIRKDNGILW
eukprot:gene15917-17517_t